MTAKNEDLQWLVDTYWYCPTECLPALNLNASNTLSWLLEQAVWHITGAQDGYFWGVAAVLLTPPDEDADLEDRQKTTMIGSVTPTGEVLLTFSIQKEGRILGSFSAPGRLRELEGQMVFEMQVGAGITPSMTFHWANMLAITPDDPEWQALPGTEYGDGQYYSVTDMVGDIDAPTFAGGGLQGRRG